MATGFSNPAEMCDACPPQACQDVGWLSGRGLRMAGLRGRPYLVSWKTRGKSSFNGGASSGVMVGAWPKK